MAVQADKQFTEALSGLDVFLAELRRRTPRVPHASIVAGDLDLTRFGWLDGQIVPRAVITLRSVGCAWTRRGGGCTMCGHYAGACLEARPDPERLVAQFETAFAKVDWARFPMLCLYNGGSILNKEELPDAALDRILASIAAEPRIREVAIETRAEFVSASRLGRIKKRLADRRLAVALGMETARADVLALCVHKGATLDAFAAACRVVRDNAMLRLYVLAKPPWLTEAEMLDDAVAAIKLAESLGAAEIHFEPLTIQRHTLLHLLWTTGRYRLPWLWSLVEILRRVAPTPVYVSPFAHLPRPIALPHNCGRCDGFVRERLLDVYNRTLDASVFDALACACQDDWRSALAATDPRPLAERVLADLPGLWEAMERELPAEPRSTR
ncbi:MAG: hypothetical protein C4523_03725 [Myxococcales bacterium]|nr:MAG: hypothetical protein C4523_03725 [Myxococcales bacterium]